MAMTFQHQMSRRMTKKVNKTNNIPFGWILCNLYYLQIQYKHMFYCEGVK